jgi:LruC domain-containing protein
MKKYILILLAGLSLSACKKTNTTTEEVSALPSGNVSDINEIIAPPGFNYETSKATEFSVTLFNNADQPLSGIRVDIMDKSPEQGGKILFTGSTNKQGVLLVKREMPLDLKQVVVNTDYIGLPNNVLMDIIAGRGSVVIGGKNPQRIVTADVALNRPSAPLGKNAAKFSYRLGSFSSGSGIPNYLMPTNDVISSTFLADVNASLPERQPVPQFRPEYLNSTAERNLILKEQCDVWITFVHEGAGYLNSLFYFVYNVNNKPTTISQVDSFIAIFPNASYSGSGGGLNSGNKVHIGRFGADTAIGFAIAANGWNGSTVTNGYGLYTSIKSMNPETNPAYQEHVVLLYDNPTQRFLIGFEDINRMPSMSSDNDFNDVIIYATANPVKAIQTNNIVPVTPSNDADDDGVNDTYDEYPNDPARAFNVYYPSASTMATVAFEDLWPSKGDYDLNDVVVDFQYHAVTNGNNEIKDLNTKFKLRAAGGVFKNAFAVALPFSRSNVTMAEGSSIVGLETAANEAILKVFNNSKAIIGTYNTLPGKTFVETDTLRASLTLTNPVEVTLGTFNPFIYIDENGKGRGYEVHLPGQQPTSLVNASVLGTNADATNPAAGVFYKTANGLPFAIAIPESFDYPVEKEQIIHAHLKFAQWVQSAGALSPDWYKNLSGNRNNSKIYIKP